MTLKQFKCIHEWDLIGMVSFTWYSAFQKLKRNTIKFFLVLQKVVKGNKKGLLLNSCSLIPAKYRKTKPHAQPSGSGLFFVFLEVKSELEQICRT